MIVSLRQDLRWLPLVLQKPLMTAPMTLPFLWKREVKE
nr:MAG TPA: hypothetical protein [Caudoviricetes sp.]